MSRVHEDLRHRPDGRRPVRARSSALPSVLVSDSASKDHVGSDPAIHQIAARLKDGIAALRQENERLKRENMELRRRVQQ